MSISSPPIPPRWPGVFTTGAAGQSAWPAAAPAAGSAPRRLLIVDDQPEFGEVVRRFFRDDARVVIVGTVGSGAEAMAQLHRLRPDVVVMDVELPDLAGFRAAQLLRVMRPQLRVVLVGAEDGQVFHDLAAVFGAALFLPKRRFRAGALLGPG